MCSSGPHLTGYGAATLIDTSARNHPLPASHVVGGLTLSDESAGIYRKVLLMVGELHEAGFQRLRIYPALSPSGMAWRCPVGPSSAARPGHGAIVRDDLYDSSLVALYSSASGSDYFGIEGGKLSPRALGRSFMKRYPTIAEASLDSDWEYAGWFQEMLRLTRPRLFPYAVADWELPRDHLPTTAVGVQEQILVPLPPLSLDANDSPRR
jgi:hypothetical protein